MRLVTSENIGPGFASLFFSLALFLFGVLFFFTDKSTKKFNFRASLLQGAGGKALAFFLLNILLVVLLFLFGPFIAIFVFIILACFALKQQTPRSIVLFSVIYTIVFYFFFLVLFKMPFNRGFIFQMLGWYI